MEKPVINIDKDIKQAKDAIALKDALERLMKNRDFKKVFLEHYSKEFAQILVSQRGLPEMRMTEGLLEANTRKLDAVGEFAQYMRGMIAMGHQSEVNLANAEKTRDDALRVEAEMDEQE